MGNRLSKIYTRTGDKGTTGLGTGGRIAKNSTRMIAIGEVDELNSLIGVIRSYCEYPKIDAMLAQIQHDLFDIGGEISMPGYELLKVDIVDELEYAIDNLNADLSPLKNFILPAGQKVVSHCHVARSVCRRTERSVVTFNQEAENPHQLAQSYINRLSDYLFVLCRWLAKQTAGAEVYWESRHVRA